MTERRFGYLHRLFGDVIWDHILPHLHIAVTGEKHLTYIDRVLADQGKVFLATNHESHLDFLVIALLLQENITSPHALAFLASMKFFDGTLNPLVAGIAHYLAYRHDYLLLPTIQNIDEHYSAPERASQNINTVRKARTLLKEGAAIVGLAPEGGRSDGTVNLAQPGSGTLVRYADEFLPIAINGTSTIFPKSGRPRPFAAASITVGEPIESGELTAKSQETRIELHDLMMLEILKYLPEEKWGAYSGYLLSDMSSS